ncbi:MAG: inositol monophosphatase family protein [Chloroflexota bacterium]
MLGNFERNRKLIQLLVACSEQVRDALLRAESHRFAEVVGLGADGADTSHIDQVAEEAAITCLDEAPIEMNIFSEEVGYLDRSSSLTAIVDPIDATNNATALPNFINQPGDDLDNVAEYPLREGHIFGFPYYAFSVGVLQDGELIAGCVRNLPTGEIFTAIKGDGVRLDGVPVRGSGRKSLQGTRIALIRPETETALRVTTLLLLDRQLRVRLTGCSALDLALIASGSLDGLVNPNLVSPGGHGEKIVDYAGALMLLNEMGGVLTGFDGSPISLDLDLSRRTPLFAAGTPELHAALTEHLHAIEWPEQP